VSGSHYLSQEEQQQHPVFFIINVSVTAEYLIFALAPPAAEEES